MQMLQGEAANIGMPTNRNDFDSVGAWIDRFQGNSRPPGRVHL